MLIKKILGILILILNAAGIGFLLFVGAQYLWKRYVSDEDFEDSAAAPSQKSKPDIANDDIIVDEDDLLKDMDLSDLDDLDLDDFD